MEGITLRQFIEELESIAKSEGDKIEVVAYSEANEIYTPVIGVAPCADGVRRVSVA